MSPRAFQPNGALRAWLDDLSEALALLTRLPAGRIRAPQPARAVRAYPLAGALVGLIGGFAFWLAESLGLPPLAVGLVTIGATLLASGALHEDGLADVADGFGGARERERKLAIMRDSRIGSFGVIALMLSIGLRAAALAALASAGAATDASAGAALAALVTAHALARAVLPPIMALLPLARDTGLAAATGRPDKAAVWTALAIGAVIAVIALDSGAAVLALLLAAAAAVLVALLARAQIGGYTGDVLGTAAQAAEVAVLLGLATL